MRSADPTLQLVPLEVTDEEVAAALKLLGVPLVGLRTVTIHRNYLVVEQFRKYLDPKVSAEAEAQLDAYCAVAAGLELATVTTTIGVRR